MNTTILSRAVSSDAHYGMISLGGLLLITLLILLGWWTVRTKKYVHTLLGIAAIAGAICWVVGFNMLDFQYDVDVQQDGHLGLALVSVGLVALLGVTMAIKSRYWRGRKNVA